MTEKERRKFKRIQSSFEIIISFLDKKSNQDGTKLRAESINVSANGILFNYGENLKIGTYLLMSFFPTDSADEIIAEGMIIRSKKKKDDLFSIAVHFTEFEKGDETELNEILHSSKAGKAR
jgi:c-di-GMP-binding flagellar brake protein YcgR